MNNYTYIACQIVFFEMNYMFSTGSERIVVLENLRKPEINFPPTWEAHRTRQKQSTLTDIEYFFQC